MKPLHIPKIRALDMTERYWEHRRSWNALVQRFYGSMARAAAVRRRDYGGAYTPVIPPAGEEDWRERFPNSPYIVRRPLPPC